MISYVNMYGGLCLCDFAKSIISSGFPFFLHTYTVYMFVYLYTCSTFFTVMFTFHLLFLSAPKWCMRHKANINFYHFVETWLHHNFHTQFAHKQVYNMKRCVLVDVQCIYTCKCILLTFSGSGWWTIEEDRLYSVTYIDQ